MDGSTQLVAGDAAGLDIVAGNLADETRLPRELVHRFGQMWYAREQPFFHQVTRQKENARGSCACAHTVPPPVAARC